MRLQIGNFPRRLDFEARVVIGGGLGFGSTSIGTIELDKWIHNNALSELKTLLDRNDIALANVWVGPLYHHEGDLWREMVEQARPRLEAVARLGGKQIGINTPNRWPKAVTEFEWDLLVAKYRSYADTLAAYDLDLVLEYLGPHCGRPRHPSVVLYPFVDNINAALELVERIDRPNVGLILDVIHWWAGGGTFEDLARVKDIPLALHFFDLPKGITLDTVEDTDRVLPGEGFLDLPRFLRILKDNGFDGDVMPEILRAEDLAEADSWEGPKRIRDAYFAVFAQV